MIDEKAEPMRSEAIVNDHGAGADEIRSSSHPNCNLCGTPGALLYEGLSDRLFAAPGNWNLKRCRRPECGLLWLDPMPLEDDIGKAYKTYFTHSDAALLESSRRPTFYRRLAREIKAAYLANRFGYGEGADTQIYSLLALAVYLSPAQRSKFDIPVRYFVGMDRGRLLDIGCGDGSVLKIATDCGWDVEGVDFDVQAVKVARSKGLKVHSGRLADCNYPTGSFDLILMSHVIEHIHDPLSILCETRRLLRAGGLLVLTTPNTAGYAHRYFGSNWVALDPPRHLHIFDIGNLRTMATRAGFSQNAITTTCRITASDFTQSRTISRHGNYDPELSKSLFGELYGQAAALTEALMRIWKPLGADEILLEARK